MFRYFISVSLFCLIGVGDAAQAEDPSGSAREAYSFSKIAALDSREPDRLKHPRRIVSGVLAADEVLAQIAAPSSIVGVSAAVDNPALSKGGAAFGAEVTRHHGSIEEILKLEPDLVIVADYSRAETLALLNSLHIPIVRLRRYSSFSAIQTNITQLGQALGREKEASHLLKDLEQRLSRVKEQVKLLPQPGVLYYSEGGVTAGRNTVIDEQITFAGGRNLAREAGFTGDVEIPSELVLALMPEVIILPGWQLDQSSPLREQIINDSRWSYLPAVREKRIYTVPSAAITSLSQHAADGVELLACILHPEVC